MIIRLAFPVKHSEILALEGHGDKVYSSHNTCYFFQNGGFPNRKEISRLFLQKSLEPSALQYMPKLSTSRDTCTRAFDPKPQGNYLYQEDCHIGLSLDTVCQFFAFISLYFTTSCLSRAC